MIIWLHTSWSPSVRCNKACNLNLHKLLSFGFSHWLLYSFCVHSPQVQNLVNFQKLLEPNIRTHFLSMLGQMESNRDWLRPKRERMRWVGEVGGGPSHWQEAISKDKQHATFAFVSGQPLFRCYCISSTCPMTVGRSVTMMFCGQTWIAMWIAVCCVICGSNAQFWKSQQFVWQ